MQCAWHYSFYSDASDCTYGDTDVFGRAGVGCVQRARHSTSRTDWIFQKSDVSTGRAKSALHLDHADRVDFDSDHSSVLACSATFRQHVGRSLIARNFRPAQRGVVSSTRQDFDSDRCVSILHVGLLDWIRSFGCILAGVYFHNSRGGIYCRRSTSRALSK